jgi:acetoin utilization deacetylase AcuC-like enzyme
MQLTMPVVWSDDCRLHDPAAEIWIGVRTPAVETAARTDAILEALRAAGGHTVPAEQHEDGRLLAVHDSGLLEYLASAWADFVGFAGETGAGSNRNLPLAPESNDEAWLNAIGELAAWASQASALVVSLGVDAAAGDPESPLQASATGYREAGRILGGLGLPTVVVQEGGYDLAAIGTLVRETLLGIEAAG